MVRQSQDQERNGREDGRQDVAAGHGGSPCAIVAAPREEDAPRGAVVASSGDR